MLLDRLPDLDLAVSPQALVWRASPFLRGLSALPGPLHPDPHQHHRRPSMTPCPVTGTGPDSGAGRAAATNPVIVLDPLVRDLAGEGARLRAAGPLAPVELPGGVRVWAVTRHAAARKLLTDSRLVKNIEHWAAYRRGEIPPTWPLIGLADPGPSMLTFDGPEHRRLRALTAQALTPRRVAALRPRIEEITHTLLDGLEAAADAEGRVDLKSAFAYPLPMAVIGDLLGIDTTRIPRLRTLFDGFFSSVTPAEEVPAIIAELGSLFGAEVARKRESPGDDLTSARCWRPRRTATRSATRRWSPPCRC